MADYPFTAEYAKSSRASCKGCMTNINKESLRLGIMVQSPVFDGRIPMWHHWDCFWRKTRVADVNDVHGFDSLRWEDQEKVRDKISDSTPLGNGSPFSKKSMDPACFTIGYSKSASAKCRLCNDKIQKQSIRIENLKKFYHFDCAVENTEKIGFDIPANELSGFDKLVDEDQAKCTEMTKLKKRPPEENAVDTNVSKKQKITDENSALLREQLKKQSEDLWRIQDALKQLNFSDLGALLFANKQKIPVQSKIIERLSDCMLFGALLPCSDCRGQLVYSSINGAYVCTGSMSAFTKCQFSTQIPNRAPFSLPFEYLEISPFLMNYKFIPGRNRIFTPEARRSTDMTANGSTKIGYHKSHADFVSTAPSTAKLMLKDGAAVDPDSKLASTAHVYQDKIGNKYTAVLNAVDVQSGINSFYKLQLIELDAKKKYRVFRAWGRIGTSIGKTKIEKFASDLDAALDSFKTIYYEKTGNDWEYRKHFVKFPGRFMPVEVDYNDNENGLTRSKVVPKSKSILQPSVQDFIFDIFDVEKMNDTLKEFEIDLKKMPLGKLSKNQIKSAYSVLTRLQGVLNSLQSPNRAQILDCTNQFYSLVPHDFGMNSPPLIDSLKMLKSKSEMLESLLEIELAYHILTSDSMYDERDPIDIHYEKLGANLRALDKESAEYKMITQYAKNTHGATHILYKLDILEILEVERHGEAARFAEKCANFSNRRLLWHGSRTSNFAGIVSQGLRIAPPEAPTSGYMFGKGIYFADMISKSANYCCPSAKTRTGYLLLCEVALGEIHQLEAANGNLPAKLPIDKQSVQGCGKTAPDPTGDFTLSNGVVVPMGKGAPTLYQKSPLLYNEFIVYDVAQVNLKYILKVNFKGAH